MFNIKLVLSTIFITLSLAAASVSAAPLADGTTLTIDPGVYLTNDNSFPCAGIEGSCVSQELITGFWASSGLIAGTDGGIIIGKDQASGGQELAPSSLNDASGELVEAFRWLGVWGTLGTAPTTDAQGNTYPFGADLNTFDSVSCSGIACIGKTQLNTLYWDWNGVAGLIGSVNGCVSINCNAEQQAGILMKTWQVNVDNSYLLEYENVIPDGTIGLGGVNTHVRLQGQIISPPDSCDYPVVQVTSTGGGQSPAINSTLTTTFTGILTDTGRLLNGGKNTVKICPGTAVDFEANSTSGVAVCKINGVAVGGSGKLTAGDSLICSNKPDGSDTDRFSVKSGI